MADEKPLSELAKLEPANTGAMPKWTTSRVETAFRRAQDGVLQDAADLCDALRTDARIRGVLQTRTNALLGSKLVFEALGESPKNEVTKALEEGGEWWAMAPENTLSKLFTWSLLLNVGLAEIVWERDALRSMKWRPTLVQKHPRNLRWDWGERRWYLTIATKSSSGRFYGTEEIPITPGDGRWFLYHPFGDSQPWTDGLVWSLTIEWLSKVFSRFDWDRRNEARGRSALVGMTPDGSLDKDREKFAQDIQGLRTKLGIALPPGYDLKSVEFGASDHETFSARIQACDANVAILVLGQNLTTEVRNAGSYAAGRAQERVRQDYLEGDAENASTGFHKQLLVPYAGLRFGNPSLAPYPIWDTTPAENVQQAANVVRGASEALDKLVNLGVDVDIADYCKKFGIPILSSKLKPRPEKAAAEKPEKDGSNA